MADHPPGYPLPPVIAQSMTIAGSVLGFGASIVSFGVAKTPGLGPMGQTAAIITALGGAVVGLAGIIYPARMNYRLKLEEIRARERAERAKEERHDLANRQQVNELNSHVNREVIRRIVGRMQEDTMTYQAVLVEDRAYMQEADLWMRLAMEAIGKGDPALLKSILPPPSLPREFKRRPFDDPHRKNDLVDLLGILDDADAGRVHTPIVPGRAPDAIS